MASWTPEQADIYRLRNNIFIFYADSEGGKKTIDAMASYRQTALPALTDIATMSLNQELKLYALEKIKQINDNRV